MHDRFNRRLSTFLLSIKTASQFIEPPLANPIDIKAGSANTDALTLYSPSLEIDKGKQRNSQCERPQHRPRCLHDTKRFAAKSLLGAALVSWGRERKVANLQFRFIASIWRFLFLRNN